MSCKKCEKLGPSHSEKPVVSPGGKLDDILYTCPDCGQRWWQFNTSFHLWKATDEEEYKAVQKQYEPYQGKRSVLFFEKPEEGPF